MTELPKNAHCLGHPVYVRALAPWLPRGVENDGPFAPSGDSLKSISRWM